MHKLKLKSRICWWRQVETGGDTGRLVTDLARATRFLESVCLMLNLWDSIPSSVVDRYLEVHKLAFTTDCLTTRCGILPVRNILGIQSPWESTVRYVR
ncbi:hypothetical protein HETIRDRAFT_173219 [Heterobasidion irregulare TC 32-1]|uniref:Uncharacterized protein n=1 Tax=Heterobasidion irregulare (strain TC 32-1) TaxID=747525 RepID=W4K6S7_HETIT|nr:uncharacterized protein HETIRDRAFT_173219 [Heterobasidion irregulare TC 32-1]ETW81537.1 hypothetical protein HETIRDRAFT_173219 [Heterobasidion irregulare TC 32-1]